MEGEKACEALWAVGIPAVGTVSGAAVVPSVDVLSDSTGRPVILWPDNDAPGRAPMSRVASELEDLTAVGMVDWPDAPPKGDAVDFLAGRTADDVRALLATAVAAPVLTAVEPVEPVELPWPAPLATEAMHGLAGRLVAAVEPYSEADPAAVLLPAPPACARP